MNKDPDEQTDQYLQANKKRRLSFSRIGIILIALGVFGLSFSFTGVIGRKSTTQLIPVRVPLITPTVTHTPVPTPINSVAYTSEANIVVLAAWPHMQKYQSVDVNLSLVSQIFLRVNLHLTPTPASKPTETVSEVIPIGTPGILLKDAFGAGYDADVIAQLSGAAFTIQPSQAQTQALDQKIVSFHWSVLPNDAGSQVLEVSLTGQWRPNGSGSIIERPLLQAELDIDVDDTAFLTWGGITIGELLVILIGSVLNIPAAIGYVRKKREEQKQKQQYPLPNTHSPSHKGVRKKKK